jgi:hypothetical protein
MSLIKLADLVQEKHLVTVQPGKEIEVRALTLNEMVLLLLKEKDNFLALFGAGLEGKIGPEQLAPFLLASPDLVADIIAMSSGEPEAGPQVKQLAATVQLIALSEIWKASVPDPKKAQEVLSQVMGLLQSVSTSEEEKNITRETSLPKPSLVV